MSMNSFHARTTRPPKQAVARVVTHASGVRADQLLVQQGFAPSRTVAQRLIEAGRVQQKLGAGETAPILKPAQPLAPDAVLAVLPDDSH
jgi:23S rRNA (cytidine1920-2'-O)/16S rRNA (cytidine1409-2'-O)-methyltransferase